MLVVLNVNHGPWLSGQFLAQKGEAVLLLMKALNAGDQRFDDYKEDIAFEQGLPPDADPKLVFDAVLDLPTFRNPGPFVRRSCFWEVRLEGIPGVPGVSGVHAALMGAGQVSGKRWAYCQGPVAAFLLLGRRVQTI